MKTFNKLILLFASVFLLVNCNEDDHTFGDLLPVKNIEIQSTIIGVNDENPHGDGSGLVDFVATAENAISYKYIFSDGTTANSPSGIYTKRFNNNGINTYQVTVLANGKGGVSSSKTIDITVFSNFKDSIAVEFLTGNSSKKWYVAANEVGHLGVGPNSDVAGENYQPIWYAANPFEKAGSPDSSCLYDQELEFALENDIVKFKLNNGGKSFFNADFTNGAGTDLCLNIDTDSWKTVTLSPSESILMSTNPEKTTGTEMTLGNDGFLGYFINQTKYEILSITENRFTVRAVMGGNDGLAWYMTFTTNKPVQGGGETETEFTNLVWSDDFNGSGAPDDTKWTREIGGHGWGNGESQNYTNSNTNSFVSDGTLKIVAKKELSGGMNYSSARLISKGKFDFKYGKVEVRAKLPVGGGTWPAIWMLGSNYETEIWPACGEIDIMEHVGNEPNKIHGTLHLPGNSGGNPITNTTMITGASDEFHVYSVVWTETSIKFYVDGNVFHTYANSPSTPFNANFFLILNVAMGGSMGGIIDSAFTSGTMEVDYVKVFQ